MMHRRRGTEWVPLQKTARESGAKNQVEFPERFKESAREVARFISLLDKDPDEAMKNPAIERFVGQLARTGFVGGVYVRHTPFFRGPAPEEALPRWLHSDFL